MLRRALASAKISRLFHGIFEKAEILKCREIVERRRNEDILSEEENKIHFYGTSACSEE